MGFLQRKVNTIFIMLGNSCNMNCKYCLQHPLVHTPLTGKVNPAIYGFIKSVQQENEFPVRLQFYGGEPLLYFPNIKEIIEHTQADGVKYSIITNGRAMTDEMVEFFNSHNMPVTISWDGPHVLETRGFDSFDPRRPLRRRLLRLKNLGLSAVVSAKAYPKEVLEAFQKISDDYYRLHQYQVGVNLDEIFDTGLPDKSLLNLDYKRVEQEMSDMTALYISNLVQGKPPRSDYTKMAYIGRLHQSLKWFYVNGDGQYNRVTCCCGNGYSVLNLDLAGNLYTCHNVSTPVGSIKDSYFSYLRKIIDGDPTIRHKPVCKNCLAVAFCQGGCKLVSDEAREQTYCKLKRAMFVPVLSMFQRWGEQNGGK